MGIVGRLSDAELLAWVEASCKAQGVPVKVTDPGIVRDICALLGAGAADDGRARQRRRRPVPEALQPPEGLNPGGIDGSGSRVAGSDHGVVQDGGDDGVLADAVQSGPLAP